MGTFPMRRAIVLTVLALQTVGGTAYGQGSTLEEILQRHREAQSWQTTPRLIHSETRSSVHDTESDYSIWSFEQSELRQDGARIDFITRSWGRLNNEEELASAIQSRPGYDKRVIWSGQQWTEHHKAEGRFDGFVSVSDQQDFAARYLASGYTGSVLDGIFPGDEAGVSTILSRAQSIELRGAMEEVGGVMTHVIDAVSPTGGAYTLWIDPQHGYHIAKARMRKTGDDLHYGEPVSRPPVQLPSGTFWDGPPLPTTPRSEFVFTLDKVEFERIGEVWVPVSAEMEMVTNYESGRTHSLRKRHVRTSIETQVDFTALGAFIPDIPNGTRVYNETSRRTGEAIQYEWYNGGVRTKVNDVVLEQIEETIGDLVSQIRREDSERREAALRKEKDAIGEPSTSSGSLDQSQSQSEPSAGEAPLSRPALLGGIFLLIGFLTAGVLLYRWRTH